MEFSICGLGTFNEITLFRGKIQRKKKCRKCKRKKKKKRRKRKKSNRNRSNGKRKRTNLKRLFKSNHIEENDGYDYESSENEYIYAYDEQKKNKEEKFSEDFQRESIETIQKA